MAVIRLVPILAQVLVCLAPLAAAGFITTTDGTGVGYGGWQTCPASCTTTKTVTVTLDQTPRLVTVTSTVTSTSKF